MTFQGPEFEVTILAQIVLTEVFLAVVFPCKSSSMTEGEVQTPYCGLLSRCALGQSFSFSLLLQHFPTYPITTLSLQMKDHTQREAKSPGQLTNHIRLGGAAFQVQYTQT